MILYTKMAATATHCVTSDLFGKPIIVTKITMHTVSAAAEYIKILRRPNLSIVKTRGIVPAAKRVFIIAASNCARNGDRPTWAKMTVL
jgi:hypothetical protein